MKKKVRKIKFYTIGQNEGDGFMPANILKEVISYVLAMRKEERVYDMDSSRFCLIDNGQRNGQVQSLIFKSARNGYRSPLLDRTTIQERDSPKTRTEGEREKTHAAIKFTPDDAYLLLEVNGNGINIYHIMEYFKKFTKEYRASVGAEGTLFLDNKTLAKENFLDELNALGRVVSSSIYVEKQIIGSDSLNFSNRINSVRHDVEVIVKAKREENIKETMRDVYNNFIGVDSKINKIRIWGKNQNNNDVVVDTSFIEKVEHIEAEINAETGELSTSGILTALEKICNSL